MFQSRSRWAGVCGGDLLEQIGHKVSTQQAPILYLKEQGPYKYTHLCVPAYTHLSLVCGALVNTFHLSLLASHCVTSMKYLLPPTLINICFVYVAVT